MFVDDSAQAELWELILPSIHASEQSAYTLLGHPNGDRRTSCLSEEKWRDIAHYTMEFLGFEVNTRTMMVRWPVTKRLALKALIDEEMWLSFPCRRLPREVAQLLGIIQNAAYVAPLGSHLSIRLQQCLNAAVAHAGLCVSKRWWFSGGIDIPAEVLEDIATVYHSLDDNAEHPVWQSYIGFLVDRAPTVRIISDTAYEGLGGWSEEFNFMWRVSCEDLARMGFSLKRLQAGTCEPDIDAAGHHINILEFVAIIVNIWLIIVLSRSRSSPVGGHIFAVFADNTSALSWLRYASRSHRPNVCWLARFVSALLFASGFQGKVQGKHLAGLANRGADALSRCRQYPTWACAVRRCSHLSTCQAYRLPPELFLLLASITSEMSTVEVSEREMTALLKLVPSTLRVGCNGSATTTSLSPPSRPRRGSRS
jgi:hypothetical protein